LVWGKIALVSELQIRTLTDGRAAALKQLLVLFDFILADYYACPACAMFCSENSFGEQEGGRGVNSRHLRVSWEI